MMQDCAEQAKDVYAHFGLAMYWAQVFEHGVVNLIGVYRRLHGRLITDREIEDLYEREFEKTLGGILRDLKSEIALPKGIEAKSEQALQIRNRLSHRYFREHAEDMINENGRALMIQELLKMREVLVDVDRSLEHIMFSLTSMYGLTRDQVDGIMELLHDRKEGF